MVIDVKPVTTYQRCTKKAATQVIYWLGVALGRKFPNLPEGWAPTVETVQKWVGWQDIKEGRLLQRLQNGEVPLRLFHLLPIDLREAIQEDALAKASMAPPLKSLELEEGMPQCRTSPPSTEHQECPNCHQTWVMFYEKCGVCEQQFVPDSPLSRPSHRS